MSYRHPETGEWAHNLSVSPSEDSWKTYLEPAWDVLGRFPHVPLKVIEVGFGRGYNCATLLREAQRAWPGRRVEITAFEPHPEGLLPWSSPPQDLKAWMPWWGRMEGQGPLIFEAAEGSWRLDLHLEEAQQEALWNGAEGTHLFLLDLFSPGRHPDGWRPPLFDLIATARARNAALTTYSCARSIRDSLLATGWTVERLRCPGWRDTLVAHFDATPPCGSG